MSDSEGVNDRLKKNETVPARLVEDRMTNEMVDTLYNDAHDRRVVIFRRSSGTYGYCEEHHYKNDVAEGWAPLSGRACHWDSLQTARREVAENVWWLPKS